ncbi:MAG TPA: hypothetical protein VMU59_14205 [Caulobacteraceae bacterium]|nr:hypothetical protein [Caulobacteraceae bacterium]
MMPGGKRKAYLAAGLTARGTPRKEPPKGQSVHAYEIEPGRSVPNNWDEHLFETWTDRKARLAAERARQSHG